MSGVTVDDIIDLLVTNGGTSTSSVNYRKRIMSETDSTDSSLLTTYTVNFDTSTLSGATYTSLSSQLTAAVSSGTNLDVRFLVNNLLLLLYLY